MHHFAYDRVALQSALQRRTPCRIRVRTRDLAADPKSPHTDPTHPTPANHSHEPYKSQVASIETTGSIAANRRPGETLRSCLRRNKSSLPTDARGFRL